MIRLNRSPRLNNLNNSLRLSDSLKWLLVIALSAAPVGAQRRAELSAETIEKIEAAVSAEMARDHVPGVSVAVAVGERIVYANGFGLSDLENSVPAKVSTVYRLASISKPITATAVMQLAERGTLDLDAPIQKYCPAFPEKRWGITIRQLLGHLGGVRHYRNPEEIRSTRHYTDVVTPLEMFNEDPLLHEPGTAYSYTTYGYNLLGCAVEGVTGESYVEFVRQNIFVPAGMDRIRPDDAHAIIPNRAQGYRLRENGDLRNSDLADTSNKIPGGGFASTVIDLVKFAIAVQNGTLVTESTRKQMWTPQKTSDGNETSYGLGWMISEQDGRKEVSHGGGQQRVSTLIFLVPANRVAVALMMNLEGVSGRVPLARKIADLVTE